MTRGDLRARALDAVNEDASAPVFVSTNEVDGLLDEALEVIAEETLAIRRTALIEVRPGTIFYPTRAVAADCLLPYRLWLHHLGYRLTPTSMPELDQRHRTWPTVTGDPTHWFPVSWDLFGIWPGGASGGGVVRVDYFAWPTAMQHDDEEPELPLADHDVLVAYAAHEIFLKRWDIPMGVGAWRTFAKAALGAKDRAGVGRMRARSFQPEETT